jgi:spermidine synthase
VIVPLALLSGAAGLVYEVAWARRLAQLCGGSALAQAWTLAAFLGGLAAGGLWLGRRAGRGTEALSFYARLEWVVAASGLLAPVLLLLLDRLNAGRLAAGLVFAQAFLMGGAVPALCGALGGEAQRGVGRVYAANSAGAVVGALAAAALLIPLFGLDGAFVAAAVLNAAAALLARSAAARPGAPPEKDVPTAASPVSPLMAAGALFASGAVALAYETAWTRLLALTLGSSAYSFAEMLAAMIAGLSVGGALASTRTLRRRDPALLLAAAELGAGLAVLATLPLYEGLPVIFAKLQGGFERTTASFYQVEAAKFLLCSILLFPVTVCLGAALPAAARLCAGAEGDRAEEVGWLLAANTAGNVLGAFAGLKLLPLLGIEGLLRAGTTVHLAVGAGLLVTAWAPLSRGRAVMLAAAAAAVFGYRAWLPRWDLRPLSQGFYRGSVKTPDVAAMVERVVRDLRLVYYKDDAEATVSVARYDEGPFALKVNGKTDASTGPDMATQVLLGQVPMLLKPGARRVLVVGWGSGVTAGAVLTHPVEALDVVELVPAVVEGSRVFSPVNGDALQDPRLTMHLEDARRYLRRGGQTWDVIVSEPSNPWMAGVGDLFSREFYERALSRLSDDGLMVQWLHTYEMDDATIKTALRTFAAVFPHATLWSAQDNDLLILGSRRPLSPDWKAVEEIYKREAVWKDLHRLEILYPSTVLAMQRSGDASLRSFAGPGPLNTERRPRLEYDAPLAMFRNDTARAVRAFDDRLDPARKDSLLLESYLKARKKPMRAGEYINLVTRKSTPNEPPLVRDWLRQWASRFPSDQRPKFIMERLKAAGF